MEKIVINHQNGTFEVGGIEFVAFPEVNGVIPAVAKDVLFISRFGGSNNFAESLVLKKLQDDVLPKVIDAVGEENLCPIQTDLTTFDGLKDYGCIETKISLPTLDFYRANVDVFDRHKASHWWWLATADSTSAHSWADWVLCVAPSGNVGIDRYYDDDGGVRPFLLFVSSIFASFEE